jgi:tRNA-specific 2-thiouridylase
MFPLEGLTKSEVRARARELGLVTADKPESQEICFVADNDYARFVEEYAGESRPGPILDLSGRRIGEHRGVVHYTVGQRRGLGISSPEPVYVIDVDPGRNALVVGRESELQRDGLEADEFNWVSIAPPRGPIRAEVKIRYRAPEVPCTVEPLSGARVRVRFDTPLKAVAPGQAAVLYRDDLVLGGGTIDRALRWREEPGG